MKYRPRPVAHPQVAILALFCAAISHELPVHAAPVFYLSTQTSGATPGLLDLTGPNAVAPNSTGTLNIWTTSDVRLAGVSLDLVETGGAIKFQGPIDVPNPAGPPPRWAFLDGPQVIANSSVTSIGGAAIPGLSGDGIGAGSTAGANVLVASVPYTALANGTSQLQLRVGANGISDYNTGAFAQVRFGTDSAALVNGDAFGTGGAVGSISIDAPPTTPPVVVDVNLGDRTNGSIINHTFSTSTGDLPITWSNLLATGPGALVNAPSLTPGGGFNWNSTGSPLGLYNFDVTATNAGGSDVGRLSLNLVSPAPEPPAVVDFVIGAEPGDTILHAFQTNAGDAPITWSNLVSIGPGTPANPPQLTADGMFRWDSTGSPKNEYIFHVTATNAVGSDSGELIIGLGVAPRVPEPATATLVVSTMFYIFGVVRRRRQT
jgi:hypothetical protein